MKVGICKSVTKNMGNYESAKIEYWLEKECEESEQGRVTQELSIAIDDYLKEELESLMVLNDIKKDSDK